MATLFITFLADGALWDNIALVPAYPSGFSFPRPFRYRDTWVSSDLIKEMSQEGSRSKLASSAAVLAMRFKSKRYEKRILPLRQVTLTHIHYLPGNHSVFFKLGKFFNFANARTLSEATIRLTEEQFRTVGQALFFRHPMDLPPNTFPISQDEDSLWVRYSDLLSTETSLPIRREARDALFLRFRPPSTDTPTTPHELFHSWQQGPVYGSLLTEGSSHELVFFHRVPSLISTHKSIKPSTLSFALPSGNIEFNRSAEDLTGNYQTHVLNLSSLRPSGTWEELTISPPADGVKSEDGKSVPVKRLLIPVKVKSSFWYRFKRYYLLLAILWASLFLGTIIKSLLDGKANTFLILASAGAALITAIAIFVLQQRGIKT